MVYSCNLAAMAGEQPVYSFMSQNNISLSKIRSPFFIGVAGSGMSALAQYLSGSGVQVSGSDRFFVPSEPNEIRDKLEAAGIRCFPQDGSGITSQTDLVVVSTAIEDSVPEVMKARALGIPVIKRSELLALIADSCKTIAVGGTSGKSTTSAMLFHILRKAGMDPSIISGAGLTSLIKEGLIGNAHVGKGDWLVIEADESDGSIVQYHPEIGLLLNIDKDHQEIDELISLFTRFKENCKDRFVVNRSHPLTRQLSQDISLDFSTSTEKAACMATDFMQSGLSITFSINGYPFRLQSVGRHTMENAVAAVSVACQLGVSLETCAEALLTYEGIYRRHQVLGDHNGLMVIDDYAHNPVKCAASIAACQPLAPRVVAWFQPHGYGPTRFLKNDFIAEIASVLRPDDEIWMSEIYYAGGTAVKDISAADLVEGIRARGCRAYFVADRNRFLSEAGPHLHPPCVLLLMGARDPGLEAFAQQVWQKIDSVKTTPEA